MYVFLFAGCHLHFVDMNVVTVSICVFTVGKILITRQLRESDKDCCTENAGVRYCASTSILTGGKLQIRHLVSVVAGLRRGLQQ